MKATHFIPVDKTSRLVCGIGVKHHSFKKVQTIESDEPLGTRKPRRIELKNPSFVDLTGKKYARFTVIGLYDGPKGWVVRCDCGKYCVRRAKSIKNPLNTFDRCEHCQELAYLKKNHEWRTYGHDVKV